MKSSHLQRGIKILLATLVALTALVLTMAFVAVTILDNEDYKALAAWGVERLAGWRMVVGGEFDVQWSREFRFTASDLRFEAMAESHPPALRTLGRIHTRVALAPLLRRVLLIRNLEIDGLQFTRTQRAPEDARDPGTGRLWGLLTPVVERVDLNDIEFRYRGDGESEGHHVILERLGLDDVDDQGPLLLNGNGRINNSAFRMAGKMGGTYALYKGSRPFPIDLDFKIADLQARISGTIDHPLDGRGFNLKIAVEEQELANILEAFKYDIPPIGRFTFLAELAGDIRALQITDLDIEVSNGSDIQISAEGALPDLSTGRGTEVEISQQIKSAALLAWLFPEEWEVVEEFSLSAALRHRDGRFSVTNLDARVVNDKGILFRTDGSLELGNPFTGQAVTGVDLNLFVSSPDTTGIRPFLTDAIPEIGGVEGRARLTGPITNLALEDLAIERGGRGPVKLTTRGRIGRIPVAEDAPLEGIEFDVHILADNSKILREFYKIPLGELGTVDLTGKIVGSSRRFKLQDLALKTRTPEGLATHATGGIDFAPREDGRMVGDLGFKLRFEAPSVGIGEPLLGISIMPSLGPVQGEADVTGTTEVLTFENILVTGGDPDRLHAEWRGRVDSVPLVAGSVSSGHNTYGTIYAARSSDFAALFGLDFPDVGPVWGNWRDTDREGVLGMADMRFAVGDGKRFNLEVDGRIDNIVDQNKYETAGEEQIEYAGADFRFHLETADSQGIAEIIGLPLPGLGPVEGTWRLTGGKDGLAIQDARLTSRSPEGLVITAAGSVPQIDVGPDGGVRRIDIGITADAPYVAALPLVGDKVPRKLGAFQASARLKDRETALDLDRIQIRTGSPEQPTLVVDGRLHDIDDPPQTGLEARFETAALHWLEDDRTVPLDADPRLTGSFKLGRTDERLRIEQFAVAADEWGGLAIEGAGTVALTDAQPRVDLQLRSEAADPAAWGRFAQLSLPPLAATQITGWYREQENQHQFSGDVRIGQSRFQADFVGTRRDQRPVVEVSMAAQTLRLQDLGFYPPAEDAATQAAQADQADPEQLMTDSPLPLEALNAVDLALSLRADQIVARDNVFKDVGLDVTVQDGRLQVGPTELRYLNGSSTLEAFVDTNESPPLLGLNMVVEDADIQELLASVNRPLVLGGQLTLLTDLRSSGRSAREIAANLEGEVGFVIENGRVQRVVELLASDTLDFLFTGAARRTYTDLDCTALRMVFSDGVGRIQVFFLETPGMRAEAFGHVDLNDETIAVIINPTSKRRLLFRRSSPVRINGPLRNPSYLKVPAEEAAILAGQVLVPVVALPARALGVLWSVVSRDAREDSCFIPPDS